jgi:hypothetical protein
MSLDKAIEHHKEKRQMYRGSKAIDYTCRNHGSCEWCRQNRQHKFRDKESDSMKIVYTYIADDGTEFDSKYECEEYEKKQQVNFESVILLDDEFNRLFELSENTFEVMWYMKILDGDKASDLMKWAHDYTGICMDGLPERLKDEEVYAWDDDRGEWYNPAELAVRYKNIWDAIEKAVDVL